VRQARRCRMHGKAICYERSRDSGLPITKMILYSNNNKVIHDRRLHWIRAGVLLHASLGRTVCVLALCPYSIWQLEVVLIRLCLICPCTDFGSAPVAVLIIGSPGFLAEHRRDCFLEALRFRWGFLTNANYQMRTESSPRCRPRS
jgi:hypothetical protein